ncbi:sulfatase [Paenibacillus hamazuiensis]|uniref:sulfatase n=1 Tax=Paenibacillus hamazuiensis TaxID=2936508 RepID=UPI00200EB883|nr:sulfatase [Paenibacillus hamazuiensis]
MKAIMVMFDTLNRHMLPPYGCDWTYAPNFARLAEKTVVFDNSYVGSMPCMPARRELMTGRYNFLHRSWGPLEPFDDAMPELLGQSGVYTHLVTDHQHYWEDGGGTYHTRYSTFELIRGQEGDPWIGQVKDPETPESINDSRMGRLVRQDWINRKRLKTEEDFPQAQTFARGLEFIRSNHKEDRWFLQLETFDPHEPFHTPQKYKDLYPHNYDGKHFDWPPYAPVSQTPEEVAHMRCEYAALLSMCDEYLGKVLDLMDELDLWKDTLLIVNTDHGFLLGEHDWWAKCVQPFYNEVAHTPLFIWDPRCGRMGERRSSLVQTIDLAPTLLEFFGVPIPKDMKGKPLKDTIASDVPVREAALFGIHGGHINCTDGRYVYMRAPVNANNRPLYNYTLMPTHMRSRFSAAELQHAELSEPFDFTKGVKPLKIESAGFVKVQQLETMLFDLQEDPQQLNPLRDSAVEDRMLRHIARLMRENDAPAEQYVRMGIEPAS